MKPTREFIPLDDYERELLEYENDESYMPESIPNLEEEKDRLQKIAKYTIEMEEARKALDEISKDNDFNIFVKVINEKGLSIKKVLKEFIHKIAFEKSYNLKNI